ncbi:hypothetical protein U732_262 [Clostridium argentinense CDC 2741]|uniref:RiboL-PSP-HEPN domain-containing protein n=1 Tax=Clostridium argentinense CDC 2741 TaxID=1418104 RepID=A0A0C1TWF2_9CLOT|nr:hypothetical protein [Clostridium argentinense]ARC83769.1 hypothetical protein RSJ17_04120 [Clostridium argentinense]KIE45029.1 hypothetical protein U732_262 [Clostridium argentinense CDC 2741]NFF39675.1 hypothetical protein [Clostridium argentinense]NFP49675.1 hypothetical protein [Clostridium argentinense]NFP72076.1 hypothetical protein [Clostridium argentinense]
MDLKEFVDIRTEHLGSIFKMKVYVEYAKKFFNDFPNNLDKDLKEQWNNEVDNFMNLLEDLFNNKIDKIEVDFMEATPLFISLAEVRKEATGNIYNLFQFDEIIFYQALVMNYARIDAYFNDIIKYICEEKPEIMLNLIDDTIKKNEGVNEKSITWKQIIGMGSYENIIDYISEDFIYKLGLKSIKDRINFLNSKVGLNISKEDINLELIYKGEQYRHNIVHRGGVVDNKLIKAFKEELKQGDKIKIDEEFLNLIFDESAKLISYSSCAIEDKFFSENNV